MSESLQPQPSPMTRHWGAITWGTHSPLPLPLPNPKGLKSLLGISGQGISMIIKGTSALELAVPE